MSYCPFSNILDWNLQLIITTTSLHQNQVDLVKSQGGSFFLLFFPLISIINHLLSTAYRSFSRVCLEYKQSSWFYCVGSVVTRYYPMNQSTKILPLYFVWLPCFIPSHFIMMTAAYFVGPAGLRGG